MAWRDHLKGDPLTWLLEAESPGVRYLALRDLCDLPPEDKELKAARRAAHERGPIAAVLDQMDPAGFWEQPGPGYYPKYRSAVWSLITLALLGARLEEDPRLQRACVYQLDHALTPGGQFSVNGAPSGTADCLQGNLCWALVELGCEDSRLEVAYDWLARSVTGEGIAPITERNAPVRYYAGKCAPVFACGSNNKLPCAWGGVKVMLALGRWPAARRTAPMQAAIQQGIDFFFSVDPATAAYPTGFTTKPSSNWWKFGFPLFYITDLLQLVEALVACGYGADPRLENAWKIILDKQDSNGCWPLEYNYGGKTWVDYGEKKQPNKWVTLRAVRALKNREEAFNG
ncbi:MAG: hypothetical protein PHS96_10705 [Anaerolineales bacterium]|nr:hypothetical protein [Anaerolineales bacterium]